MDLLRATLRALYYDFPIEILARNVEKCDLSILEPFCQLVRWREPSFTMTEIESLRNLAKAEWLRTDFRTLNGNEYPQSARCLLVPIVFSSSVLDCNESGPTVKLDNLLRWRELSLLLGEDLFTVPMIAKYDFEHGVYRNALCWSNVLEHNDKRFIELFDKSLPDVHSHYGAQVDVFDYNWLSLMNNIKDRITRSDKIKESQENPISILSIKRLIPLRNSAICAASLRAKIAEFLYCEYDIQKLDLITSLKILSDDITCEGQILNVTNDIQMLRAGSLKMINNIPFDYAIRSTSNIKDEMSPFVVHHGERKLIYDFYQALYKGNREAWELAPYMYLYLLIKIKIRREFIETNSLHGFSNFNDYQSRKSIFIPKDTDADPLLETFPKYAIQSAIRISNSDKLETRSESKYIESLYNSNFSQGIFCSDTSRVKEVETGTTFVATISKKKSKLSSKVRFNETRKQCEKEIDKILSLWSIRKCVGIDALGNEFNAPPEVFGHVYRYARKKGLKNQTFHVGEDFYDIIGGLRAIDEAIRFLELDSNCRIGHGLALGIDPGEYYKARHHTVVMPKQELLDNLVWFYHKTRKYDVIILPSLIEFIERTCFDLFHEIGYKGEFDFFHYWNSMLQRGNDVRDTKLDRKLTLWEQTANSTNRECESALQDKLAKQWFSEYIFDPDIRVKGIDAVIKVLPPKIEETVYALQEKMICAIASNGIAIECNPSSNVKIGPIDKYIEHPIFRFNTICDTTHDCRVSINTDDKGIFATSLYNEYSLLVIALMKCKDESGERKYSNSQIVEYLEKIRMMGHNMRFC